jgi:hypothetical protein
MMTELDVDVDEDDCMLLVFQLLLYVLPAVSALQKLEFGAYTHM